MHTLKHEVAEFNKEIGAKADEAKARLDELESHAKHNAHQNEATVIAEARKLHAKIDSQRKELDTAEQSKADKIKANIKTDLGKLDSAIHNLHSKLHGAGNTK